MPPNVFARLALQEWRKGPPTEIKEKRARLSMMLGSLTDDELDAIRRNAVLFEGFPNAFRHSLAELFQFEIQNRNKPEPMPKTLWERL